MKNKRTKLTALLLSALMAVSTISSVTWATDLFSDGSDETEVVAEEFDGGISDVEEEVVADKAELNGIDASNIISIEFKYDSSSSTGVIAEYKLDDNAKGTVEATSYAKKDATCFEPQIALYSATIKLTGKDGSGQV